MDSVARAGDTSPAPEDLILTYNSLEMEDMRCDQPVLEFEFVVHRRNLTEIRPSKFFGFRLGDGMPPPEKGEMLQELL